MLAFLYRAATVLGYACRNIFVDLLSEYISWFSKDSNITHLLSVFMLKLIVAALSVHHSITPSFHHAVFVTPPFPVVLYLQGGYNLVSIANCMATCTSVLLGDPVPAWVYEEPQQMYVDQSCLFVSSYAFFEEKVMVLWSLKLLRCQCHCIANKWQVLLCKVIRGNISLYFVCTKFRYNIFCSPFSFYRIWCSKPKAEWNIKEDALCFLENLLEIVLSEWDIVILCHCRKLFWCCAYAVLVCVFNVCSPKAISLSRAVATIMEVLETQKKYWKSLKCSGSIILFECP